MMWERKTFKEFVQLQRGFDLTRSSMADGEFPVLGSNCIIGYHKEFKVEGPGVITGRSGTLGEVQYVDGKYWPHNTSLWVKDFKKNHPRFVYYMLQTLDLKSYNGGGAVPTLNRNNLDNIEVNVPPYPIQQKIAAILSTYDDLIENNLKRIALLEKSARLLYEEWFVRLRFPGYEHTTIVDGVPEGWEKQPLSKLSETIDYGYTASATSESIGPKFLRITDIVPSFIDWTSVPYCEIPDNRKEKFLLRKGDIVVARTGATTGYAKRIHSKIEAVFASYLIRIKLKEDVDDILVGTFMESDDYKKFIQNNMSGAAQPGANAKIVSSAEILLPPSNLQSIFRNSIEPLLDQKEILVNQNQKLKQARDILLPKLINGEIPV
jgi:type I restriction enzyme, S subunit